MDSKLEVPGRERSKLRRTDRVPRRKFWCAPAVAAEKAERKAEERRRIEAGEVPAKKEIGKVLWNNGYSSGTLAASIKLSSNAVIRN